MQWTNFDPDTVPPPAREMHVTLDPRGLFYLNHGVIVNLADPVAVRLMFDKEEGLIGMAAVPLRSKASFELRAKHGSASPARTFIAKAFCLHLECMVWLCQNHCHSTDSWH